MIAGRNASPDRPPAAGLGAAGAVGFAVGLCAACGLWWWTNGGRAETELWEVSPQTRADLEPAFTAYLRDGPLATGTMTVLGAELPVDLIERERTAYFCLIPADRLASRLPEGVWITDVGNYSVFAYRRGFLLAVLDPRFALDLFGDSLSRDAGCLGQGPLDGPSTWVAGAGGSGSDRMPQSQ